MAEQLPEGHDQNDLLIYSLRHLEKDNRNTQNDKLKKLIDEGFKMNFSNMRRDPDRFVEKLGDQVMLVECAHCATAQILHVTNPGEACKLESLPPQTNHALMVSLEKSDAFKMIKGIAEARYKDKEIYAATIISQNNSMSVNPSSGGHSKNPKIPDYTPDNFEHWSKMIKKWDTVYGDVKPIEKYFSLLNSLKGQGDALLQKLQNEEMDFNEDDIIEKCMQKLETYLEKTELNRLDDVNAKYRQLNRASDESTTDYISRFKHVVAKQKEVGLIMNPKQHAIDLLQNAHLDANARNIVVSQIDFSSDKCLEQLMIALQNVTPNASGAYYNERGRSPFRNNRFRSKSNSRYHSQHSSRCPCSLCKAHDKDWEEHMKKNRGKNDRSRDRRYPSSDNGDRNQGKNFLENSETYCITSAYLNAYEKQVIIDTGCVPSLMSSQDLPYLESLIGRKLQPTGHWMNVRFGDGKPNRTEAVVKVPFWDGSKTIEIDVGIVKDKIPFLLGMSFLRNVSKNMIIDEKVELKGGAVHPVMGDGRGHMRLSWSRDLHLGSEKVSDPKFVNSSQYFSPDFKDFYDEEGVVAFKAEVTVNSRDLLLDDESVKYLSKAKVISRKGWYDEKETDAVYLYRTNQVENLQVSNPFSHSTIEKSIIKNTHDRGLRDNVDLEEEQQEVSKPKIKRSKVSFSDNVTVAKYEPHGPPTILIDREFACIKDNGTSLYFNMTRSCTDIVLEHQSADSALDKNPSNSDENEGIQQNTKKAKTAVPIENAFWIRSSGQITYLDENFTVEGDRNENFGSFIVNFLSERGVNIEEKELDDSHEKVYFYENWLINDPNECFSRKQIHDANKRKPPKKKAVRGHKKATQNLKPNIDNPGIREAMDVEIEKFKKYGVFEEVLDTPYLYKVPSNWVITKKDEKKHGNETFKARLVALGNLDRKINLSATDSPTLSRETMRILLSTIANLEFQLQGCDVSSAFLQGAPLDRTVYMNPPVQYRTPGKVWLLKKPVYGLADSGRLWYKRLKAEILKLGCKELTGDGACFHMSKDGSTIGLIGAHVDDLIYGGTPEFEEKVIKPLMTTFSISKTDVDTFVFCGMTLRQNSDLSITVSQREYSQTIEDLPDYSNMNEAEKTTLLKSVAGQVMYLSLTRPDLVFDSSELLRVGKTTDERLKLAAKLLIKVKNGNGDITFRKLGPIDDLSLMVYSDASYNNIKYGKVSTAGSVILLKGKNGNCAPLQWVSRPIIRVTRSTMAAEARALELAADYAVLFSRQIKEIYTGDRTTNGIPVTCYIDSHTVHDAIVSSRQVEEKSLVHLIYCLKDKLIHSEIDIIKWVNTHNMLADGLTKSGVHMDKLMAMIQSGRFPTNMVF